MKKGVCVKMIVLIVIFILFQALQTNPVLNFFFFLIFFHLNDAQQASTKKF